MPNRRLSPDELKQANALLDEVRERLGVLAAGDPQLLFAFRRKISKELTYDERGKPALRVKLKATMRKLQNGICPACNEPLPEKDAVLDRTNAIDRYVVSNVRLICRPCDLKTQTERGFA